MTNVRIISAVTVVALAVATLLGGSAQAQSYPIQTPGVFHTPSGHWQTPGKIQVPKGIQAIKTISHPCGKTYTVGADALFAFDKSALSSDAKETLGVLGPMLAKAKSQPIRIVGYTDAVGSVAYNQTLSEQRAQSVRDWLAAHGYIPASTPYSGRGKADPVAPNTNPDGSDNPAGRQKNRRVEILVGSCH